MRKPIAILSTTVAFLSLEVPRSGFLARRRSTRWVRCGSVICRLLIIKAFRCGFRADTPEPIGGTLGCAA
jgi:hypothetical protein